ncbi:MAG: hypothetical protein DIZ80_17380 [endosymbiont of Galathealinum brachiosum]|uniref:GDYXXLXY domain-containing protein n=1 Tax=endosymbiont of Galathealinum brachiosum TaxID=2200906 RepID=A0A370D723_9GAMM|nr:MAG: hypothetical protein DIZ80_17380 [endosymbiont of Galathealinum brachiosum]
MRTKIALLSGVIILILINWSIYSKEKHLSEGKVAYLELAPVDPRSLMQGDYMALRFSLANKISAKHNIKQSKEIDGFVVVTLDDKNIASFSRLDNNSNLEDNELLMHYRIRDSRIKFATNAFFFQEGNASEFEKAKYGQFRVNNKGDLLLVSMHDKDLIILGNNQR